MENEIKCPVNISEKAIAEIKRTISEQETGKNYHLRIRVVGGGCSGFKTKLDIDSEFNDKIDQIYESGDIKVVIDKKSKLYLENATIDFHNDLNKRGFVVDIVQAKSTCGCGSSWSM